MTPPGMALIAAMTTGLLVMPIPYGARAPRTATVPEYQPSRRSLACRNNDGRLQAIINRQECLTRPAEIQLSGRAAVSEDDR